jgi:O-antigen/teichoic acid export membrane protein
LLVLAGFLVSDARWRALALRPRWLIAGIRQSVPLYIKDLAGALNLYLDRFLISALIGLEATGIYTLYWSVANVVHNLSVASLVQPRLPELVDTARRGPEHFRALEKKLQREVAAWTVLLMLAAALVMPLILPWLERPQLGLHLPLFWIVLVATALRIGADAYGFALLALHRDMAIAVISVGGVIASAALNLALIPAFGVIGAGYAFVLTALGLFVTRFWLTRMWPEMLSLRGAR